MKRAERPLLTFVIDSREILPYDFAAPDARRWNDGGSYVDGIDGGDAGDYTCEVDGERVSVRIERKSMSDFFGVVGRGRERFFAELARLREHERAYVIIEATAEQVKAGFERSKVTGDQAWGSACSWMSRFNIPFIFAGNRRMGRQFCQRLLEDAARHLRRGEDDD